MQRGSIAGACTNKGLPEGPAHGMKGPLTRGLMPTTGPIYSACDLKEVGEGGGGGGDVPDTAPPGEGRGVQVSPEQDHLCAGQCLRPQLPGLPALPAHPLPCQTQSSAGRRTPALQLPLLSELSIRSMCHLMLDVQSGLFASQV